MKIRRKEEDRVIMKTLHPEYIIDKNKRAVLIPIKEWQKILEDIEELEDIKAYDNAKTKKLSFVSFNEAIEQIPKRQKN